MSEAVGSGTAATAASDPLLLTITPIVHESEEAPAEKLTRCPNVAPISSASVSTGAIFPWRCQRNACGYCGPRNAGNIARAIALAEPERAITLTLVPTSWGGARRKINRLVELLRKDGYEFEMAYHLEPNPRGTGAHGHAWQHGDYVPQNRLQELCQTVGLGIPYIERVRSETGAGAAMSYGLKGMGYGMKHAEQEEFIALNGGRLVHHTRAFFRHGSHGPTLTQKQARRAVWNDSEDLGPWHTVRI